MAWTSSEHIVTSAAWGNCFFEPPAFDRRPESRPTNPDITGNEPMLETGKVQRGQGAKIGAPPRFAPPFKLSWFDEAHEHALACEVAEIDIEQGFMETETTIVLKFHGESPLLWSLFEKVSDNVPTIFRG